MAEQWYRKSLAITERQGNEYHAASTYHQLGRIAQEQRDFATAEQWYRKALAIWVKYGDQHNQAITRSNLEILRKAAGSRSIPEPGKGNLLHLLNETVVAPILRKVRGLLR
jgi:tetratricopeptide (TPR) repeat protein